MQVVELVCNHHGLVPVIPASGRVALSYNDCKEQVSHNSRISSAQNSACPRRLPEQCSSSRTPKVRFAEAQTAPGKVTVAR